MSPHHLVFPQGHQCYRMQAQLGLMDGSQEEGPVLLHQRHLIFRCREKYQSPLGESMNTRGLDDLKSELIKHSL